MNEFQHPQLSKSKKELVKCQESESFEVPFLCKLLILVMSEK